MRVMRMWRAGQAALMWMRWAQRSAGPGTPSCVACLGTCRDSGAPELELFWVHDDCMLMLLSVPYYGCAHPSEALYSSLLVE